MWCNGAADILEVEADSLESFDGVQKDMASMSKDQESKILSKTIHQGKLQTRREDLRLLTDSHLYLASL